MPLVESSADDGMPTYSADGRRLAFMSARTGPREVWVADASGPTPAADARARSRAAGAPMVSGRAVRGLRIARARRAHAHLDDRQRRWPAPAAHRRHRDEGAPTWSADGHFVYFGASRGHGYDIWRVPARAVPEERITTGGSGYIAFETPDGRGVLYQQKTTPSALLLKTFAGARQPCSCPARRRASSPGTAPGSTTCLAAQRPMRRCFGAWARPGKTHGVHARTSRSAQPRRSGGVIRRTNGPLCELGEQRPRRRFVDDRSVQVSVVRSGIKIRCQIADVGPTYETMTS